MPSGSESDRAQTNEGSGCSTFDSVAQNYEDLLQQGLALSGEAGAYFAENRILHLQSQLQRMGLPLPKRILDYGCGTGGSLSFLLALPGVESVIGTDLSDRSLQEARNRHSADRLTLLPLRNLDQIDPVDLIFCNGVFHHIPPADRPKALQQIHARLTPAGHFAFFENNPWNPGTRWVMSRIPFDREAQTLSIPHAKSLLRSHGFSPRHTSTLFYFPRSLRILRPIEALLHHIPLGAQYLILSAATPPA
jgi:SAM-dependent methyltransferase